MKKLTRRRVKKIWKQTCKQYGAKPIYARGATQRILGIFRLSPVQLAKKCLAETGVNNVDEWLSERFMFVQVGKRKYIVHPEKLASKKIPKHRWLQALGHECEHCEDCEDHGGWIKFYSAYALRKGARAVIEGRGEAAGADVYKELGRSIPRVGLLFDGRWRDAYKMRAIDVEAASAVYKNLTARHDTGLFATTAGGVVVRIIREVCG